MELSHDQLIRARRGDRAAQGELIRVYQDRVYAVCRALVGGDAEDCAQDVFLKVLAALPRFVPGPVPLGAFVLRVARNHCIDRLRTRRVSAADPDGIEGGRRADEGLRAGEVRAAVARLPEEQRAAVALRTWGELEYEEIAAIEGVPVGTIRSRLSRAREALRLMLGEEQEVRHARR
jgi:RNA polymerase sigma-70 factor (ECF subfamily)